MALESTVDPTYPVDSEQVDKALIRANALATFNDINNLYRLTSYEYRVAVGDLTMLA